MLLSRSTSLHHSLVINHLATLQGEKHLQQQSTSDQTRLPLLVSCSTSNLATQHATFMICYTLDRLPSANVSEYEGQCRSVGRECQPWSSKSWYSRGYLNLDSLYLDQTYAHVGSQLFNHFLVAVVY